MSITSALANALSGLNASSREAELISNNVANALTPGYSRRTADLSAAVVAGNGAGVAVSGVVLAQDPVTTASRRLSDAGTGASSTDTTTLARITDALGLPGEAGALASRTAAFETALLAASNAPDSDSALRNLAGSAGTLASTVRSISTETQRVRVEADAQISQQVELVNRNLRSIELLNREIRMLTSTGGDPSALIDQRKALIDNVSSILPIRAVNRSDNQIALFTTSGAALVDGPAAELGFTRTPTITADMTLASGALSGLTLNGRQVEIGAPDGAGMLDGGSLSALFTARDHTLPEFATRLDAFAAEVISRFQDPVADPTLSPGDAGLFTDGGQPWDPIDLAGLSGRIELNAAVDPQRGGDLSALRDGLGATTPGPTGATGILQALYDAATESRAPDPALGQFAADGLSGFAAELTSQMSARRLAAEEELSYRTALGTSLAEAESRATGVDTDRELQRLLAVEQSYAANARVLSVADGMIRRLLEI